MKALALPLIYFLMLLLGAAEATAQSQTHIQTHPFSPLRQFLQQDSDTTIVFQNTTNWMGPSALYAYFLSKKGDRLQLHAYRDFVRSGSPDSVSNKQQLGPRNEIILVPESRNRYFNPLPVSPAQLKLLWSNLMAEKPWLISDNKVEGEGCPVKLRITKNNIEDLNIYDGGGIQCMLITKNQIKALDFYAPDFYEKQCPGRAGRIAILKISALFDPIIQAY